MIRADHLKHIVLSFLLTLISSLAFNIILAYLLIDMTILGLVVYLSFLLTHISSVAFNIILADLLINMTILGLVVYPASFVFAIGLLKELVHDKIMKRGTPEFSDVFANTFGILLFSVPYFAVLTFL